MFYEVAMKTFKKIRKKCSDFFYDHPTLRTVLEYLFTVFGAILSALVFAFGYKAFIDPIIDGEEVGTLITGGAAGLAQIFVKLFDLCGFPINSMAPFGHYYWNYIIQSAAYVLVNVPIFILAYRKIGKKFAVFTLINVAFYFVIVNLLPSDITNMFYISTKYEFKNDFLARAIFAGICTGVSNTLAFKFEHSAGGIDAISVYFNGKRNHISIGKISMIINALIVIGYTVLSIINEGGDLSSTTMALYSCVYLFTSSTILDVLSSRDKKNQLQIITSNPQLPDVLINYFPHSCTIVNGKGAYTKQDKLVIYIVLSIIEVKKAIKIIQEIDPNAFIEITKVEQVVGRFFIQPRR